jgi:hypothetical protein
MKRLIAAAALAAVAGSAFAVEIGKPYEQLDIDRALPDVVVAQERTQFAATAGETRSDASSDVAESGPAVSPFAHQHDFIAPAY